MRVTNEAEEGGGGLGPFGELIRLQTDFQARLAEETLRYLRRLQGTMGPAAPGTVVLPEEGLTIQAASPPGGRAGLRVEIENLQRVHCMVTPQLTPLVGRAGTTWFPAAEPASPSLLLPPGATDTVALDIAVPEHLPPDLYTGALLLQGFRRGALGVSIEVRAEPETEGGASAAWAGAGDAGTAGAPAAARAKRPRKAAGGEGAPRRRPRGTK